MNRAFSSVEINMFPFHIGTNLLTFPRQHLLLTKNLHFLNLHASQSVVRFLCFKKLISLVSLAYRSLQ